MAFNLGMTWAQLLANIAQNSSDITEIWGEVDKLKIVTENDDYSTVSAYVQATPIPVVVFTDGNGGLFPYAGTYNDSHYFGRVKQVSEDEADVVYEIAYIEQDSTWRVGDATPLAPIYSPNFGGNPTAPTRSANDNSTNIATTAYADRAAEMAGYSAFITETVSGDIVSIIDGASNIPVKAFTGSILPQQNLNGQSAPYPAGGGKNKFNEDSLVAGDYDGTSGSIRCHADAITLTSGQTVTVSAQSAGTIKVFARFGDSHAVVISGTFPQTYTASANGDIVFIFGRTDNSALTPADVKAIKVQVEFGSSPTAYAPYANVCPISGWTGANITRAGKNLIDWNNRAWVENKMINAQGEVVDNTALKYFTDYLKVKPSTVYSVTGNISSNTTYTITAVFFDKDGNFLGRELMNTAAAGAYSDTFTTPSGCAYVTFNAPRIPTYTNFQVEEGSTATAYEAYNGSTIVLSFGQTVYAGTLTALGGGLWKIQPTHAVVDMGSLSYAYADYGRMLFHANLTGAKAGAVICESFRDASAYGWANMPAYSVRTGGGIVRVRDADYTDATAFKNAVAGVKLVYPLADASLPDPITITGEDLQTLLGANTVWTDVGAITGMTYRADTALYIDKKLGA